MAERAILPLKPMSAQQHEIVAACAANNVIVDAVAGSGKTMTCLHIAAAYPKDHFLLLTYNRALMDETCERIGDSQLMNMEVRTYHSFCASYYGRGHTNEDIEHVLENKVSPIRGYQFERIIIDETQDMTQTLYFFTRKIVTDNGDPRLYLYILGDKMQMIYGFRGADLRFLTMANLIHGGSHPWRDLQLNVSFRTTSANAAFINNCMLKQQRIIAARDSKAKPIYMICDSRNPDIVFIMISGLLERPDIQPGDIMILAASIKMQSTSASHYSPVNKLMNRINKRNIDVCAVNNLATRKKEREWPIARQEGDDGKTESKITRGKILFSTIHGVKGCERKYVFIYGFDASYFKHHGRDECTSACPNLLYVAATRATHGMYLIHDERKPYLPFLNVPQLPKYATVIGELKKNVASAQLQIKPKGVSQLTKWIPEDVSRACLALLTITTIRRGDTMIDIPVSCEQPNGYEQVADITGAAIPVYYQATIAAKSGPTKKRNRKSAISMINHLWTIRNKKWMVEHRQFIKDTRDNLSALTEMPTVLRLCTIFTAYEHDAMYRAHQIANYNWITDEARDITVARIESLQISATAKYEAFLCHSEIELPGGAVSGMITGYADCIDASARCLYEFKCVRELNSSHKLQLAVYALLNEISEEIDANVTVNTLPGSAISAEATTARPPMKYILYNIMSNEMLQISAPIENLKRILELLLSVRDHESISDDEFIARYC